MIDERLVDAAAEILTWGSCLVSKSTRSGFTTSITIAAKKAGKRLLVVTPTVRIIKETLNYATDGDAVSVPANAFCPQYSEMIQRDRFLAKLPLPLADCEKCEEFGRCDVTRILTAEDTQVVALTYAKLFALMLSDSNTAEQIRKKISDVDMVLLDEAHTIALPQLASVRMDHVAIVPEESKSLRKCIHEWEVLCEARRETIKAIQDHGSKGHVGKHLAKLVPIEEPTSFALLKLAWGNY